MPAQSRNSLAKGWSNPSYGAHVHTRISTAAHMYVSELKSFYSWDGVLG